MDEGRVFRYTVDLDKEVTRTVLRDLFMTENKNAHTFRLKLVRNGKPVDLTGGSVLAGFNRHKVKSTLPVHGRVDGSEAVVTLSPACYAMRTIFTLVVDVTFGDVTLSVFAGEGQMLSNRFDKIDNSEGTIPTLNELFAELDAMREATAAASTAAQTANNAAAQAVSLAQAAAEDAKSTAENAGNEALRIASEAASSAQQTASTAAQQAIQIATEATKEISAQVAESDIRSTLLADTIPNTIQQYDFAADGTISRIDHMRDGQTVRVDAYTFIENAVEETRTLSTGESLTIITNLTTLETTVTYTVPA